MAQWYGIYQTADNDVVGAGFFAVPGSVEPGTGNALTVAQDGDIPNDLIAEDGSSNYTYSSETVVAKS